MSMPTQWWLVRERCPMRVLSAWPLKDAAMFWVEEFCGGMDVEVIPVEVTVRLNMSERM